MKKHTICLLPGDGIGPEIMDQACKVAVEAAKSEAELEFTTALLGGAAIDATGKPLPEETVAACKAADGVLLGAVGGPKWDSVERSIRPETGLLGIRKALGLFSNLRPAVLFPELAAASCLRTDIVAGGIDLLVVRELTGGIYFGEPRGDKTIDGEPAAYNTMVYKESEVRRVAHVAFKAAQKRGKRLCSVDKANVLDVSRLWREVVIDVAKEYPDVTLEHMYVDNAAMQLVRDPSQFDVIVTSNLFGDILSDEAAALTGSIGMLPSASLGAEGAGLFEPIHGSAPDIAGQDKANPLAMILSVAMLFRHSLDLSSSADRIDAAVRKVLSQGYRTGDIMSPGCTMVGCREMGRLVLENL